MLYQLHRLLCMADNSGNCDLTSGKRHITTKRSHINSQSSGRQLKLKAVEFTLHRIICTSKAHIRSVTSTEINKYRVNTIKHHNRHIIPLFCQLYLDKNKHNGTSVHHHTFSLPLDSKQLPLWTNGHSCLQCGIIYHCFHSKVLV